MLLVEKIDRYMCQVINTETGTPFEIPTHWLQIPGLKEGDVIKVVKDELAPRRLEKEAYEIAKKQGIAHLFDWQYVKGNKTRR